MLHSFVRAFQILDVPRIPLHDEDRIIAEALGNGVA